VGAGEVEVGVARLTDVHHRGNIELDHLLVDRVPPAIGERRVGPHASRRVRVEVDADEAELVDAALQLGNAGLRRHAGELRQHADRHEVVRVELADAIDQVVPVLGPVDGGRVAAEVVGHGAGAGREERYVRTPLPLHLDLRAFQAFADLVIADLDATLVQLVTRGHVC
jgi:hypothetical protein